MKSHFAAIGVGIALAVLIIGAFMGLAPLIARKMKDSEGDGIVTVNVGDSRGSFALKDDGREASANWDGDFEISADARSFVARAGDFSIDMTIEGVRRRAKWSGGSVEFAAGEEAFASGAGADTKAAELLRDFARISGMNAERRVKAIAAQGGLAAALEEAEAATSESAALSFIEAIIGLDQATSETIERLLARARKLDGDYERRRALALLYASPKASAATRAEIIIAAEEIGPPHELRLFIEDAAIDAAAARPLIPLVDEIDEDRDARRAIEDLLSAGATTADDIAAIAGVIGDIDDARQARLAIEAAFDAATDKDAAREALRRAAAKISEAEERARAEEALQ